MYSNQTFPLSSIKTALGKVTHNCTVANPNGQISVLISLGLSAAYDTVDHDLLLKTLSLLCFQESTQLLIFFLPHWFFLSQLSLLIFSHFSNTSILDCSQGPGLKPLLFSSYPHFLGDPICSHGFKFYLYFNTQFCNASSTPCLDLPLYVLRVYMYIQVYTYTHR